MSGLSLGLNCAHAQNPRPALNPCRDWTAPSHQRRGPAVFIALWCMHAVRWNVIWPFLRPFVLLQRTLQMAISRWPQCWGVLAHRSYDAPCKVSPARLTALAFAALKAGNLWHAWALSLEFFHFYQCSPILFIRGQTAAAQFAACEACHRFAVETEMPTHWLQANEGALKPTNFNSIAVFDCFWLGAFFDGVTGVCECCRICFGDAGRRVDARAATAIRSVGPALLPCALLPCWRAVPSPLLVGPAGKQLGWAKC